jgi:RNAse (barnase) inhibitor barstar
MFDIDLRGINNKQALFTRLKADLSLPNYFGANWDALEECLRDLEIRANPGVLIVFYSADALLAFPAFERQTFISIFNETAHFWEREHIRFSSVLAGSPVLAEAIASLA